MQRFDDKAIGSQDAYPVTVTGMEFDATARPVHTVQIALWSQQPIPRLALFVGHAQGGENAVRQENKAAIRTQEPRCFVYPALWLTPHARAVFADDQVKARITERYRCRVRLDEREVDTELLLTTAGSVELRGCEIDANGAGAATREPRREIGGTAAQLDDVEASNVTENSAFPVQVPRRAPT